MRDVLSFPTGTTIWQTRIKGNDGIDIANVIAYKQSHTGIYMAVIIHHY